MTRDPKRIPETLRQVQQVWEKYPDLRLGQLLWGLAGKDPFYMEDDRLIKRATEVYVVGWEQP